MGAISPWQRGCYLELKRKLSRRHGLLEYIEMNEATLDSDDPCWVFITIAVKQADRVAWAQTAHLGKMASFGTV
jgi:hypothetical protein